MANGNSPFEDLFFDTIDSIKNNFKNHDKYLNFALLLAIAPFPFIGIIALLISLLGFYLNRRNKFAIDETSRLVTIFLISILNISLTLIFAFNVYSFVFNLFYEIMFNIKIFFYNLFFSRDIFI
jgi:hypothetical protein